MAIDFSNMILGPIEWLGAKVDAKAKTAPTCPLCGCSGYQGLFAFECEIDPKCRNYLPPLRTATYQPPSKTLYIANDRGHIWPASPHLAGILRHGGDVSTWALYIQPDGCVSVLAAGNTKVGQVWKIGWYRTPDDMQDSVDDLCFGEGEAKNP